MLRATLPKRVEGYADRYEGELPPVVAREAMRLLLDDDQGEQVQQPAARHASDQRVTFAQVKARAEQLQQQAGALQAQVMDSKTRIERINARLDAQQQQIDKIGRQIEAVQRSPWAAGSAPAPGVGGMPLFSVPDELQKHLWQ